MCQPTNKTILCTCDFGDDFPEDYWILLRYVGQKDMVVIGDVIMPSFEIDLNYEKAYTSIRETLNAGNCFDTQIKLKPKDVLIISLQGYQEIFTFRFKQIKWAKYSSYEPFDLENKYDEVEKGTIASGQ